MFDNKKFPELTKSGDGYVRWRGNQIEHFSYSNPAREQKSAERLAQKCRHLEKLGLKPSGSNAVWFWDWFSSIRKPCVPYFGLLKQTPPCLYENQEKSVLVMQARGGRIFEWRKVEAKLREITAELKSDVGQYGIYRVMGKRGFRIADAGQTSKMGICYADRFGMIKMLKSYNLPEDFRMPVED